MEMTDLLADGLKIAQNAPLTEPGEAALTGLRR
jgi:hypothetical protein